MYLIFYQKRNGKTVVRVTTTYPHYKIGQNTSMGWYVLDIQCLLKDKFYTYEHYRDNLYERIRKDEQIRFRKQKIKRIISLIDNVLNGRRRG